MRASSTVAKAATCEPRSDLLKLVAEHPVAFHERRDASKLCVSGSYAIAGS